MTSASTGRKCPALQAAYASNGTALPSRSVTRWRSVVESSPIRHRRLTSAKARSLARSALFISSSPRRRQLKPPEPPSRPHSSPAKRKYPPKEGYPYHPEPVNVSSRRSWRQGAKGVPPREKEKEKPMTAQSDEQLGVR